jgi:hypothetical protein
LISLLRTQLKSDLAIYGATYSGQLNEYESLFLERSDVDLLPRFGQSQPRHGGRSPIVDSHPAPREIVSKVLDEV